MRVAVDLKPDQGPTFGASMVGTLESKAFVDLLDGVIPKACPACGLRSAKKNHHHDTFGRCRTWFKARMATMGGPIELWCIGCKRVVVEDVRKPEKDAP